jgi:hypothetical protein
MQWILLHCIGELKDGEKMGSYGDKLTELESNGEMKSYSKRLIGL